MRNKADVITSVFSIVIIAVLLFAAINASGIITWPEKHVDSEVTVRDWTIRTSIRIQCEATWWGAIGRTDASVKINYDLSKITSDSIEKHTLSAVTYNIKTQGYAFIAFKPSFSVWILINGEKIAGKNYNSNIEGEDAIKLDISRPGYTGEIVIQVLIHVQGSWGGKIILSNIGLTGSYTIATNTGDNGGDDGGSSGGDGGSGGGSGDNGDNTGGTGGGSGGPISIGDTTNLITIASWLPLEMISLVKEILNVIVLALTAIVLYLTVRRGKK